MKTKKLWILIAPQCSGKSTWIRNNISTMNNPFISSTDDLITTMYPDISYSEAWKKFDFKEGKKILRELFTEAVNNGVDIVIDRMNLKVKARKEYLKNTDDTYEKIAVVFPWDKETFIKRNENRFITENKYIPLKIWEECCTHYQKPTREEGFDKIIFLK